MNDKSNLIEAKMKKSEMALGEASVLIDNAFYNAAVSRIYYACFYIVNALLLTKNIKPTTHKGTHTMFNKHFVLTGGISRDDARFFSSLYSDRHLGDYGDFIDFDKSTVESFFQTAKEFIKAIEKLLKEK